MADFQIISPKIKIKFGEKSNDLPYVTNDRTPTFTWQLPKNVAQQSYIFQVRTFYRKNINNGTEFKCAYYNSSKKVTSQREHTIQVLSQIDGGWTNVGLDPDIWNGLCEVRLRIFDSIGNEYCTHAKIDTTYKDTIAGEDTKPQYRAWGTKNDGCYFVFDSTFQLYITPPRDGLYPIRNIRYLFGLSTDTETIKQNMTYTLQVSETPLFDQGIIKGVTITRDDIKVNINDINIDVAGGFQPKDENNPLLEDITFTTLKSNKLYFYRARAYDEYDYSEWTPVNAFMNILNDPPKITSVIVRGAINPNVNDPKNDLFSRENGEVKIDVTISDSNDDVCNIGLFYYAVKTKDKDGNAIPYNDDPPNYDLEKERLSPCGILQNTSKTPTNRENTFTWMSGRELMLGEYLVYIYVVAFDANTLQVNGVVYRADSIIIDNKNVGFQGGSTDPKNSIFGLDGSVCVKRNYPFLPLESKMSVLKNPIVKTEGQLTGKVITESWKDIVSRFQNYDFTINGGIFTKLNCPNCDDIGYAYVADGNYIVKIYGRNSYLTLKKHTYSEEEKKNPQNRDFLYLKCETCGKTYSSDMIFQDQMQIRGLFRYKKDDYSYYHGYHSDDTKNYKLIEDLMLVRKSQSGLGNNWGNNDTVINGDNNDKIFGFKDGFHTLINLQDRPDIEPYTFVHVPKTIYDYYGIYVDGPGITLGINDYVKTQVNENGQYKDPAIGHLANQYLWGKYYQQIHPIHRDQPETKAEYNLFGEVNNSSILVRNDEKYAQVWSRIKANVQATFPIRIVRGVNDQYRIQINDYIYQGSVLDAFTIIDQETEEKTQIDSLIMPFPYNVTELQNSYYSYEFTANNYLPQYIKLMNSIFCQKHGFQPIYLKSYYYIYQNNQVENDSTSNSSQMVTMSENSMSFIVDALLDEKIQHIQTLPTLNLDYTNNSCYDILGIKHINSTQSKKIVYGSVSQGKLGNKTSESYYYQLKGDAQSYSYSETISVKDDTDTVNQNGGKNGISRVMESDIDDSLDDMGDYATNYLKIAVKRITFGSTDNNGYSWDGNNVTFTHNLNCYPFVMIYDDNGYQVYCDIRLKNSNEVTLTIPHTVSFSGWNILFSYGIPFGQQEYNRSPFQSKVFKFSANTTDANVTWQDEQLLISHNMNCYPSIMLFDENNSQAFYGSKIIDSDTIAIDFSNCSNISGTWTVVINRGCSFSQNFTNHQKVINLTPIDTANVTWQNDWATISHFFNSYPIVTVYDETGEIRLLPLKIVSKDSIALQIDKTQITTSWKIVISRTMDFDRTQQTSVSKVQGQPIFTCYKDLVDANGHHLKFTAEDYEMTHKIYIRTFHIEQSNPFPDRRYGYRNWIVVPTEQPDVYTKKKIINYRGDVPVRKMIRVKIYLKGKNGYYNGSSSNYNEEDFKYIEEYGYFNPITGTCLSHDFETNYDEEVVSTEYYKRKQEETWRNIFLPVPCMVFDYVEADSAICKNFLDAQIYRSPFNKKAPMHFSIDFAKTSWSIYIMGAYKNTEKQERYNILTHTTEEVENWENSSDATVKADVMMYAHEWQNNGKFNFTLPGQTVSSLSCVNYNAIGERMPDKVISSDAKYRQQWKQYWDENWVTTADFAGYVVQQFNPEFYNHYGYYRKGGVQPKYKNEPYWKVDEDAVFNDKSIPTDSRYVYEISEDNAGAFRLSNKYITSYGYVSDKTFEPVDEQYTTKDPYIDYRLVSKNIYEEKEYFSGLPRSQHPSYAERPDIVYPYDRHWRICGQIDTLTSYSNWSFLFLQKQWNSYNRIHWHVAQDESIYVRLYAKATKDENGNSISGTEFSVKTKRSIWIEEFNAWCIPYVKWLDSDMIDTVNNVGFVEGYSYQFRLDTISKSGTPSASSITSIEFSVSRYAVSPTTITSTSYDPWTKKLKIVFRFDDILGRKYDITQVQYSLASTENVSSNGDSIPWNDLNSSYVEGELLDLDSNRNGDNVPNKNLIKQHYIIINASFLSGVNTDNFRIRLISALSIDRQGLTYPKFYIKMWANEFLLPAERTIELLNGSESRWVWKSVINEDYNPNDPESYPTIEKWVYVSEDEAVRMPGRIQTTVDAMNEITNKFENWYYGVGKFYKPDLDAFQHFLHKNNGLYWQQFYYLGYSITENDVSGSGMFYNYIITKELAEDLINFYKKYSNYSTTKLAQDFISGNFLTYDYETFYQENRFEYLTGYIKSNSNLVEEFLIWYQSNTVQDKDLSRHRFIYSNYKEEYEKYYGITMPEEYITDNIILETDFLKYNSLTAQFENYFQKQNLYIDTRYEERKNLALATIQEFNSWSQFPTDKNGNSIAFDYFGNDFDYISDKYYMFLEKYNRNGQVINSGKNKANVAFMNSYNNGATYYQQYQGLRNELTEYQSQLQQARQQKIICESQHRKNLIKQGFFCNGFENNKPYKSDGSVNTCFRFRVETQPYEGKRKDYYWEGDTEISEQANEQQAQELLARYQPYFRVQMDFLDTFNSQNGLPLRDFVMLNQKTQVEVSGSTSSFSIIPQRIQATVGDADMSMSPTLDGKIDKQESAKTKTFIDYQLTSEFQLLKSDLPGRNGDFLPPYWNEVSNDFNSLYFWRVAPYNIVNKPIFETVQIFSGGTINNEKIGNVSRFKDETSDNNYIDASITTLRLYDFTVQSSFTDSRLTTATIWNKNFYRGHHAYYIYVATNTATAPTWKNNLSIITDLNSDNDQKAFLKNVFGYDRKWLNMDSINDGNVQFVTDRPRKIETITENNETAYKVSYIDDNIDNYLSNWIPYNVNRQNPSVLKDGTQYIMFTHKPYGNKQVTISSGGTSTTVSYTSNAITMSIGFTSDIFGQECMVLPKYSYQSVSDIIENAFSFENPCIIKDNGIYYLYFNAIMLDDNNRIYSEVYRIESKDLDDWYNLTRCDFTPDGESSMVNIGNPSLITRQVQVQVQENGETKTVLKTYFDCYGICKLSTDTDPYAGIHYWSSSDGINFVYEQKIYSGLFAIQGLSVVNYQNELRIYFSKLSNNQMFYVKPSEANPNTTYYARTDGTMEIDTTVESFSINDCNTFNPYVMIDNHFGTDVLRIYYNAKAPSYLYDENKQLVKSVIDGQTVHEDIVIKTEFLDEYVWEREDLRRWLEDVGSSGNDGNLMDAIIEWSKDNVNWVSCNVEQNQTIPAGGVYLRFKWVSAQNSILAIKVFAGTTVSDLQCLSQAFWIDNNNISQTDAVLKPQDQDIYYKASDYTVYNFLYEKELYEDFTNWCTLNEKDSSLEANAIEYLTVHYLIRDYLKWSRKGPGIYRYLSIIQEQMKD